METSGVSDLTGKICESVAERLAFVEKSIQRQQVSSGLPALVLQAQALVADPDQQEKVKQLGLG